MADDGFIKSMTPERMELIKKSHEDLRKFQADAPARAEARRIEAQLAKRESDKQELKEQIDKQLEKLKGVKSILDYTK